MREPNRAFLEDPNRWPNWPCQTMKRYSDEKKHNEVATFVERDEGEYVLVEENICHLTNDAIAAAETITIDKVLEQGWVVN
jgi:hypothetical protein